MRISHHVVALSLLFESIDRLAGSMPAGDNTSKGLPIGHTGFHKPPAFWHMSHAKSDCEQLL